MNALDKTGIYVAYPTSPVLKSIHKAKNYKTKVNSQHTKIGKAKVSFRSRQRSYVNDFDNEVVFKPIVVIAPHLLDDVEDSIRKNIDLEYRRAGNARDWFETDNRERIIEIIMQTMATLGIQYERVG